jgi:ADP-ribosylglycohydrolase
VQHNSVESVSPFIQCLQITDDSEMAMCLLQGLLESDASGPLPLDDIASWYIRWLHSPPFDIGEH